MPLTLIHANLAKQFGSVQALCSLLIHCIFRLLKTFTKAAIISMCHQQVVGLSFAFFHLT